MTESKFQFKRPILKKLDFCINEEFKQELFAGVKIEGKTRVKRLADQKSAIVSFELIIGEVGEKSPFWIDIDMHSQFLWDSDMEIEIREKLLAANAPSLILAYMRPIVSQLTANSQYPAFDIPFLDLQNNDLDEDDWNE